MEASRAKLSQIFSVHTRYRVPLFQRPYVWQKDRQWQPLWDDLREVAQRQTDASPSNDGDTHFLGAIVVDQEVKASGPNSRVVIDGQQRLTTLQLVIAAARAAALELGDDVTVRKLEALLFLPDYLLDDPRDRLMLVPTTYDRSAFAAAVESDGKPDQPIPKTDSTHVLTAYTFFREAIAAWLDEPSSDETPADKLRALTHTFWELLRLVVIALDHDDDAQAIFETMNARGTPLLAADLVKNYLFRRIEASDGEHAAKHAYAKHWDRFDRRYWREDVGQGRSRRPRIDILLTHWLVLQTKDEVGFQKVFERFRQFAPKVEPLPLLADLDATAATLESFDRFEKYGVEETFFHRLDVLETTTFMPVILWMYGSGITSGTERVKALRALESWLVRRMLCRLTTKNYNTVALGLLQHLIAAQTPTAQHVVDYLLGLDNDSDRWPDDAAVTEAIRTVPYYTSLTRRRLRMVLDAIEATMHDGKVGGYEYRDRLTIEHVLPQAWELNWKLPGGGDDLKGRIERDAAKHRLGNLALVTGPLNSHLSNAPWTSDTGDTCKREVLQKYNQYLINKDVTDKAVWDESAIRARGETFAGIILAIWPKPGREAT